MTEFERLVAGVMAKAFMAEPTAAGIKKQKAPKKHRIAKKLDNMTSAQQEVLLLLLKEKLAMITVKGETYAYRRSEAGYLIRSLHDGEPEHTVAIDFSACSCADCKFRGRVCKHMTALKEVLCAKSSLTDGDAEPKA